MSDDKTTPVPKCESCGTTDPAREITFEACPYAADIHGDDTPVWMCDSCRSSAADDI